MQKRSRIRFSPTEDALVYVYLPLEDEIIEKKGLLFDESANGCSVIMLRNKTLISGQDVLIKVGDLAHLEAQVRWIKEIHDNTFLIGFMYHEKI